jgi:hypothetical protein
MFSGLKKAYSQKSKVLFDRDLRIIESVLNAKK